jgi:hypothetical protein
MLGSFLRLHLSGYWKNGRLCSLPLQNDLSHYFLLLVGAHVLYIYRVFSFPDTGASVKHIDTSLDWMHVDATQVLWRPGDEPESFYIVINGRLRAISENERGGVNIDGEFGQGDTVGELEVVTGSPRRNTVHAIRDTELIRMPRTLFNAISSRCVR